MDDITFRLHALFSMSFFVAVYLFTPMLCRKKIYFVPQNGGMAGAP